MRQSVAPTRDLLDRLGSPDRGFSCLLVAGTKGKGSTASLIAAGLLASGRRVGLYTSPHVERIQERVRLHGAEIADGVLAGSLEAALRAREEALASRFPSPAGDATWFDVLTAAALHAMGAAEVEQAVLECGLGGRLDSTNAVEPVLSVLTNVELEHTAILGRTRAAIAREKAGISRPGKPLLSTVGSPGDEAADAVRSVAASIGARLIEIDRTGGSGRRMEEENAALAERVLAELGVEVPRDALGRERWIRSARLPGRLERGRIGEIPVILDGAHVPGSLARVLRELEGAPDLGRGPIVVFGAGVEKDLGGLLKVLRGRVDRVLCTSLGRGPHASPERLLQEARQVGLAAQALSDPEDALDMALRIAGTNGWVLVTGSLHLVGRLRHRLASLEAHAC